MKFLLPLALLTIHSAGFAADTESPMHDIVVYGDSSGAVTAAIAAKREGRSVLLVNPTGFPGA